jgi:hypothetical protein
MDIGPVSNQQSGQGAGGPERNQPGTARPEKPDPGLTVDRADISTEARARLAELADLELRKEQEGPQPVEAAGLSQEERMELIKNRVASGYYNDPKVRARIVDRLIDDMDS